MQFMERLDAILRAQDMTVADLARKTDIHIQTIYSWRAHARFPRIDHALRVAEVLGLSVEFIATGNTTVKGLHPAQVRVIDIMNKLLDDDKWRILGIVEGITHTMSNPHR